MIKTREIFEILSRGGFICQDSARAENRRLFDYIEEHFELVIKDEALQMLSEI